MQLPFFKTQIQELILIQNKWKSILDPFISLPSLDSSILQNVSLRTGANVVNHLLGRKLVGWRVVRKRAAADIYDSQDNNQKPELTLLLVSTANVSCDIEVF